MMRTDKFRIGAVVIIAITMAATGTPFVRKCLTSTPLFSSFGNSGLERAMIQLSTLVTVVFIGWLVILAVLKNKRGKKSTD